MALLLPEGQSTTLRIAGWKVEMPAVEQTLETQQRRTRPKERWRELAQRFPSRWTKKK